MSLCVTCADPFGSEPGVGFGDAGAPDAGRSPRRRPGVELRRVDGRSAAGGGRTVRGCRTDETLFLDRLRLPIAATFGFGEAVASRFSRKRRQAQESRKTNSNAITSSFWGAVNLAGDLCGNRIRQTSQQRHHLRACCSRRVTWLTLDRGESPRLTSSGSSDPSDASASIT